MAAVLKPAIVNLTRSYLKEWILVQGDAKLRPNVVQGGGYIRTGGIHRYFENSNVAPNAEIGPKDFFEIASERDLPWRP